MKTKIETAWQLFDEGKYAAAESLYLACLEEQNPAEHETYHAILMGLVYVECFLEKFESARTYAGHLVEDAGNEEERHIALHQCGMVERMAGNYPAAMQFFLQEADLLQAFFPEDAMLTSVNQYEQGYVLFQMGKLDAAEPLLNDSLANAKHADDAMCIGCAYRALAELMAAKGHHDTMKEYCENAIHAFETAGDHIAVEEVKTLCASELPCS